MKEIIRNDAKNVMYVTIHVCKETIRKKGQEQRLLKGFIKLNVSWFVLLRNV